MDRDLLKQSRYFLKDSVRKKVDFSRTDQNRGIDPPPIEKPYPTDALRIDLPKPGEWRKSAKIELATAVGNRQSRRIYRKQSLTLDEVSFLLWATQGVRGEVVGGHSYRTVPSAGCRHALEKYLAGLHVEGVVPGIY